MLIVSPQNIRTRNMSHAGIHIYIFLISETAMLFLKPDVTKKKRIVFSLFVSLDLLFFTSNLIFDLGLNI